MPLTPGIICYCAKIILLFSLNHINKTKMNKGEFDDAFRYELDDENWSPTYILLAHVDDLKTICEFKKCV
jgi:hypothetical protein